MIRPRIRNAFSDALLSILCGLALLAAARALNALLMPFLPDDLQLLAISNWLSPIDRLAVSRLMLFIPLVMLLAPLMTWPLARHASRRDLSIALPGAACASVLYFLLARTQAEYPFPVWLDLTRGAVLLLALPAALRFWWRRMAHRGVD